MIPTKKKKKIESIFEMLTFENISNGLNNSLPNISKWYSKYHSKYELEIRN